ncbi:hypothetical protein KM043_002746 [Ampulex compressa]|nr:hypothetical protein KM043_002746 [Ampulex compressa]
MEREKYVFSSAINPERIHEVYSTSKRDDLPAAVRGDQRHSQKSAKTVESMADAPRGFILRNLQRRYRSNRKKHQKDPSNHSFNASPPPRCLFETSSNPLAIQDRPVSRSKTISEEESGPTLRTKGDAIISEAKGIVRAEYRQARPSTVAPRETDRVSWRSRKSEGPFARVPANTEGGIEREVP